MVFIKAGYRTRFFLPREQSHDVDGFCNAQRITKIEDVRKEGAEDNIWT
jgi:hypothetical protein